MRSQLLRLAFVSCAGLAAMLTEPKRARAGTFAACTSCTGYSTCGEVPSNICQSLGCPAGPAGCYSEGIPTCPAGKAFVGCDEET